MNAGSNESVEAFWEQHYAASVPGTGGPNPVPVDMVESLPPGQALDLDGGGDAL